MHTGGLDIQKQHQEDNDPRNFDLDTLGAWFGTYSPKHNRHLIPNTGIKNQGSVNSCVPHATASQKEPQEGVQLSPASLGAYLVKRGEMSSAGTSLQASLKGNVEYGIAEESLVPTNTNSFAGFAHPSQLTVGVAENASLHKSKSYWNTKTLNTILEQLDNGNIGLTGLYWYSGYTNPTNGILTPKSGSMVYGHAVAVVGYDLDYKGEKVLIFQNSFGENYGHNGYFYVRFDDLNKTIDFATYFQLDIDKDIASWLSMNAGKIIKELNSPKCFLIEGDKKRHIIDEAVMIMMGNSLDNYLVDKENMLSQVLTGDAFTINDIPPTEVKAFKDQIRSLQDIEFVTRVYKNYFPDLFLN